MWIISSNLIIRIIHFFYLISASCSIRHSSGFLILSLYVWSIFKMLRQEIKANNKNLFI